VLNGNKLKANQVTHGKDAYGTTKVASRRGYAKALLVTGGGGNVQIGAPGKWQVVVVYRG
jgi:hypothetical protein